jgi:uncharacterized membrane protein YccC
MQTTMKTKTLLFDRIVAGAAGGLAALALSHLSLSPENLFGFGAVFVLAAIAVMEYGCTRRKVT